MMKREVMLILAAAAIMLVGIGCDEDENKRLADMAERQMARQAEQNRKLIQLQQEAAEGARRLVEADAQARQEMVAIQRELQAERAEVDEQRDLLEDERRDLAAQRQRDPVVAAAIANCGLLLVSVLPLILCWCLLHQRQEPADDQEVLAVLLEELTADKPLLLPPPEERTIGLVERHHDPGSDAPGCNESEP